MKYLRMTKSVPLLTSCVFVLAVVGFAFLFLWGSLRTVRSELAVIVRFSEAPDGGIRGHLAHEIEGGFDGFRVPLYPVARIDIERKERWVFLPRKRSSINPSVPFAKLSSVDSFTVGIRDGLEGESAGTGWDFPPFDQRKAKTIEPGSMLDDAINQQPVEMQAVLRKVMTAMPTAGPPIEEPKRSELIEAMQEVLREHGYVWVADGIDDDQWAFSYVVMSGWIKIAGSIGVVLICTWVFGKLKLRKSLRRRPE